MYRVPTYHCVFFATDDRNVDVDVDEDVDVDANRVADGERLCCVDEYETCNVIILSRRYDVTV